MSLGAGRLRALRTTRSTDSGGGYREVMQWLDWYGDGSVYVTEIALACCALEFAAARPAKAVMTELPPPTAARVVVVSGTVTDRLAPTVAAMVDAARGSSDQQLQVVALGACASSGGPYWDSYSVTKGVDQLVEVTLSIPGCPPPPEALHEALDQLVGRS